MCEMFSDKGLVRNPKTLCCSGIDTDLIRTFKSEAFSENYVSSPAINPLTNTVGDHSGTFNVRQFLA